MRERERECTRAREYEYIINFIVIAQSTAELSQNGAVKKLQ